MKDFTNREIAIILRSLTASIDVNVNRQKECFENNWDSSNIDEYMRVLFSIQEKIIAVVRRDEESI